MAKDFKCDLNCPNAAGFGGSICCENCYRARLYYVNDDNRDLWNPTKGFLGNDGCKLPREEMPVECREYDCRKELHGYIEIKYAPVAWVGQWNTMPGIQCKYIVKLDELDKALGVIKEHIDSHNRECGIY